MAVFIEGRREGYAPDQIERTFTVQELIDYLAKFDHHAEVYLRNDDGYTYGSITYGSFMLGEVDECGTEYLFDPEEDEDEC